MFLNAFRGFWMSSDAFGVFGVLGFFGGLGFLDAFGGVWMSSKVF